MTSAMHSPRAAAGGRRDSSLVARDVATVQRPLRILQVGTADEAGGAAAVASALLRAYRARGSRVWHLVGHKRGHDADVMILPDDDRPAYRLSGYSVLQAGLRQLAARHPNRGWGLISRSLRLVTHPRVMKNRWQGIEDLEFPGTQSVLALLDAQPDIVHCHNLHGGFFDLRALEWLSQRLPTVLTLHDMWLLTGHCAYSLGCDRWRIGCGQCPDLNLYPAIRRDATAENWHQKRNIYAQSNVYVATPSQWLLENMEQSILQPAVREARVIPNGVDLLVFKPVEKQTARFRLGIPKDVSVVLLTTGSSGTTWKDDQTLRLAIDRIVESAPQLSILFIALGRESAMPRNGNARALLVPYQTDPDVVAAYYQAADLYIHAARGDNFPMAVLEALACGTTVVATAVGGIPEQIRSAEISAVRSGSREALSDSTGILVPVAHADKLAEAVIALLLNDSSRGWLGDNAARDARARFDLDRQADTYQAWYRTIIEDWNTSRPEPGCAAQR